MAKAKKEKGYFSKFLEKADKAIEEAIEQGIKRADDILDEAVEIGKLASTEAKKKSKEIRKLAQTEKEKIKAEGSKKIERSLSVAKGLTKSVEEDLKTLEKLGQLRKAKIISEKEFQEKKKKILSRI